VIEGVKTTIDQRSILSHSDFRSGDHDTGFVERYYGSHPGIPVRESKLMRRASLLAFTVRRCSGLHGLAARDALPSQRWPEPMETAHPLPPGDATLYPPGPEEVRVLRHADPVQVRQAGSAGAVPLSYRRKELRVASGSGVTCSEEGRVEILFDSGSSVVLYGHCNAIVGSPSRGEPSLFVRDLEQVRFDPVAEDLYELSGGTRLRARDGPVRATLYKKDVLRVANESKRSATVASSADDRARPGPWCSCRCSRADRGRPRRRALSDVVGPGFHAAH
jgi:hypothetical protein